MLLICKDRTVVYQRLEHLVGLRSSWNQSPTGTEGPVYTHLKDVIDGWE